MTIKTRVSPDEVIDAIANNPRRREFGRAKDSHLEYNGAPRRLAKADIVRLFDDEVYVVKSIRDTIEQLITDGRLVWWHDKLLLPQDRDQIEAQIAIINRNSQRQALWNAAQAEVMLKYRDEIEAGYHRSCVQVDLNTEHEVDLY